MCQVNGKHKTYCGARWVGGRSLGAGQTLGGFLEAAALSQVLSDYMTSFTPIDPKVIELILVIHRGHVLEGRHEHRLVNN